MSTTSAIDSAAFDAINSSNKTSASATKNKTASLDSTEAAQDRFLKLLTAQLQNQDPLNPLDNAQMTSQLAQISTVDGITKLNTTMQTLLGSSTDTQTFQAAGLVGRSVLVAGNNLSLKSGHASGGVNMAGVADNVVVTIKNANGMPVRTLTMGALPAGPSTFTWDGTMDNGEDAPDGQYSLGIVARQGGNKVDASGLEFNVVNSVAKTPQGINLMVGNKDTAVTLSDVKQIL